MSASSVVKDIKQAEQHINLIIKNLRELIKTQDFIINVTIETDGQTIHLKSLLK